jgi:subtilisin-like proprotein convertase family protein
VTHALEIGQTLVSVTGADLAGGGPVGGPFPLSGNFTVTSERPTPVVVDVTSDVNWLSINGGDTASVSLSGDGDSDTVSVSVDSDAGVLAAGIYTGTVTFTNTDNGSVETFTVTLDVGRFAFVSGGPAQPIGDNQTITSSLTVPVSFCIGDVDVSVNMNHTYQGDLVVELVSPEGTTVRLHNRGGGSAAYVPVTYDDDGSGTAPSGPGALSNFDGQGAAGVWTLRVLDQASGDSGTLTSWTLRPAASGDLCPPVAFGGVATIEENWLGTIELEGAASNGGSLEYVITGLPSSGVLWDPAGGSIISVPHTLSGDSVVYRADLGVVGADSFEFKVVETTRDTLDSVPALVAVTIGGSAALHTFSMDTNPGWTYQGQWAWGQPTGGGGSGFASGPDPTSGFTGSNVVGYNLAGDYGNNIPEYFATTGALAVNGAADLELSFRRWLGMESAVYDDARIQISVDGGAWQNVWVHDGTSFGDDAWIPVTYGLDGFAAGAGSIRLRWGIGPTDGSVVYPGWNIDDVVISGTAAGQRGPIDFTGDGTVDSGDLSAFIAAFLAGQPEADLTGDGQVDSGDLVAFIQEFI